MNVLTKLANLFSRKTFDPTAMFDHAESFDNRAKSINEAVKKYLSFEISGGEFAQFIEYTQMDTEFVDDLYIFGISAQIGQMTEQGVMQKVMNEGKAVAANFVHLHEGLCEAQESLKVLINDGVLPKNLVEVFDYNHVSNVYANDQLAKVRGTKQLVHEENTQLSGEMLCQRVKADFQKLLLPPTTIIKDHEFRQICLQMIIVDIAVALFVERNEVNKVLNGLAKDKNDDDELKLEDALLELLNMITVDNVQNLIPQRSEGGENE